MPLPQVASGPVINLLDSGCKKISSAQTTSHVRPQDDLYERAAAEYAAALGRLARGYEVDPDKRRDLLQEIHLALWRSFERFRADCSLRTWVYRLADDTATSWVTRPKQDRSQMLVSLEEVEMGPVPPDADRRLDLQRAHPLGATAQTGGSRGDSRIPRRTGGGRDRRADWDLRQKCGNQGSSGQESSGAELPRVSTRCLMN